MKAAAIGLAMTTLAFGLLAAWYWYRSSKVVPIDTLAELYGDPNRADPMAAVGGLFEAGLKAAKLNKWAATWTGIAAVLGAASAIAGAAN